ncbi:hypothetical protein FHS33_003740 [Streptomyces calvus]|uniref:Uncharacterized protein n=1 Tax=Streptomyces calvus TaxID=67282 RepID=A0AA40SEZ6_9ACTN|nr:hypothetical protein [Streptomyces calvus]
MQRPRVHPTRMSTGTPAKQLKTPRGHCPTGILLRITALTCSSTQHACHQRPGTAHLGAKAGPERASPATSPEGTSRAHEPGKRR